MNFRPTRLTGGTFLVSPLLVLPNPTHLKMLAALLQITGFTCMIDYKQPFYNSVKLSAFIIITTYSNPMR